MKRFAAHFRGTRGQALLLMVVATSFFMFGALGLAIDGGQIYAHQQMAQAAADAAAEAGILSIQKGTNATSTYTFATGTPPIASHVCTTTDGITPCVFARSNGFGGTSDDTVTLSYPTTVAGVTLSSVSVPALTVTVQRVLHTTLARFVGVATVTVIAKATSGITGTGSPYCIIALSDVTGSGYAGSYGMASAFFGSGSTAITLNGCGAVSDSTGSKAFVTAGNGPLTASQWDAVGTGNLGGGATLTPALVTGATTVVDPFLSLPALTPGSCLQTNYQPTNGTVLTQGTYCNGINIGGNNTVTFSGGNYIIYGGNVQFGGSSTVTGSGVTFYFTGTNGGMYNYGQFQVNGNSYSNVTLSAPTTGTYKGILFFQDRASTQQATFNSAGTLALTGSLYFPSATISFQAGQAGASTTSNIMAIIANQIFLTNNTYITSDPTGANTGLSTGASVSLLQ